MARKARRQAEAGGAPDLLPWETHEWTVQELEFCQGVLRHGNATRAWREAFLPSTDNPRERVQAHQNAHRLLHRPHIEGYLAFVRGEMVNAMAMGKDEVLLELAHLARANMADYTRVQPDGTTIVDLSGLTREQYAAIQEIKVETYQEGYGDAAIPVKQVTLKLAPKLQALEALGKHHKLFTEVIETGNLTQDAGRTIVERRRRLQAERKANGTVHDESVKEG
jgi:phage terminase small subunit